MTARALFYFALLFPTLTALAAAMTGRIVGNTDGDTLTLLDASNQPHRIRLAGSDSPEKRQDFGEKAKAHLSALAFNQAATADCRKRDKYRREICVVTAKGKDVGLEQVHVGMVWWYRKYVSEQTAQQQADYEQAEVNAKTHRLGLWNGQAPIPP